MLVSKHNGRRLRCQALCGSRVNSLWMIGAGAKPTPHSGALGALGV